MGGEFPDDLSQPAVYNWPSVLVNLLFVNGLCPFANNWVVPGGWTIGCEFLFYAMFPFLFFLARPDKRVLAATVIVSFAATAALFWIFKANHLESYLGENRFLYFLISTQMPCFLLGMAYFFYGSRAKMWHILVLLAGGLAGPWSRRVT